MSLPSYQEHISFGRYAQLSAVENRSLEVCMATRACWSMSKQSQQRCGWQFCLVGCALPFQLGHFVHKNVVNQRTGPLGDWASWRVGSARYPTSVVSGTSGSQEMELGDRRLLRSVMAAGLKDLPALKARTLAEILAALCWC